MKYGLSKGKQCIEPSLLLHRIKDKCAASSSLIFLSKLFFKRSPFVENYIFLLPNNLKIW